MIRTIFLTMNVLLVFSYPAYSALRLSYYANGNQGIMHINGEIREKVKTCTAHCVFYSFSQRLFIGDASVTVGPRDDKTFKVVQADDRLDGVGEQTLQCDGDRKRHK